MNKLVSVVIATYNYRRFVAEAVESALSQTYQPIEVIVVDDGSTDGTDVELQPYQGRIRYLFQENRGISAARNMGIRMAEGEYVALLDSDDSWAPTKIEKQVAVMERSPRVGFVYCGYNRVDIRTGKSESWYPPAEVRGDVRRKLLQRSYGIPSSVMIRRACFEAVGVFDETLRSAEDWDLWIRISRQFQFDYVPEPLVNYRIHGANLSKKIAAMHQYEMQVIHRAFRDDPGGRLLFRRTLAHFHCETGKEYYWAHEYRPALRHLLQGIVLWPFESNRYAFFLYAAIRQVQGWMGHKEQTPRPLPSLSPESEQ